MTFDIRLWLYPGANPDSDPEGWGLEQDISAYLRRPGQDGGQAIQYSGGKGDEAPGVDAGQMTLTLDNRDGRFSTDNVLGPWYGTLDINSPVRMGVVSFTDAFGRVSASGWGSPDAAAGKTWTQTGTASNYTADGSKATVVIPAANTACTHTPNTANARDIDVTMTVTAVALASGGQFATGIQMRKSDGSNYLFGNLYWQTSGALNLNIQKVVAGVATILVAATPIPSATYTAGTPWKMRMQADGNAVRVKVWLASGSEPAAWTLTTTDSTATGSGLAVYVARLASNTNSGVTPLVYLDDFIAVGLEFTGSVVSWPLRWDKTGRNCWAPITAAGILRRLRQGTYPIQSPLRRQLGSEAWGTGYWSMEGGAAAKSFSSIRVGAEFGPYAGTVPSATYQGVTPAGDTSLAGGGPAPTLDAADSFITGFTGRYDSGTGFSAMVLFKLGSVPSTKTKIITIYNSRGPVRRWVFYVSDTTLWVEGLDGDNAIVTSATNSNPYDFTEWHAWQLETDRTVGGGNTGWSAILHAVGDTTYGAQTGTVAGSSISTVSGFLLTGPQNTAFAHAWLGRNTLPFVTDTFSLVSSGYAGETAANRFARVCTEAGIPYILRPGGSERMGPQREAGTLNILQACVETDYGVMSERGAGLEYIPREARWNVTTTMALTVAAGQIAESPEPTRDDQRLRNKWTVNRVSGGQGVYQDDADIAKHGTWEDSATINSFDDSVLENHAGFRVAQGINQRLRWPAVSLNFARNGSLLPAWRARGYGWRMTISTGLTQIYGNEPDLIVEGFTAILDPDNWTADLACTSASAWRAAVADDTGILGRADNEYCQTTALIGSTTLSIPITTTLGARWDNTAALWTAGVDFNVGGERITVTSITNGTNPAQTLNATVRAVNGYPSSHASGTKVTLWDQPIVAL